jgi:integrase
MPRPAKGPRLYLHPVERQWLIRDGSTTRRTGCGEFDRSGAEKGLAAYLAEKFRPVANERHLDRLPVVEVLTAYGREHAAHLKGAQTQGYGIAALLTYWGDKMLSDVRGSTCRAYAAARASSVAPGTIRRELSVLSAAINHWHREHGPLTAVPVVTMPEKPPPRERWLTRQEAAMLLAGALGWYREFWCDVATRQEHSRWRRSHFAISRHAARFILVGIYTGTRHGAILGIQWLPNTTGGRVDFKAGVMHRKAERTAETKKRQPPVRLGDRILAHMRRWHGMDQLARAADVERRGKLAAPYRHVVAYNGEPILKLRRSWDTACEFAWLGDDVVPHTMRHTRATWMMQGRIDPWEAAGALGMSPKTLIEVYGHHHPDFQKDAARV